MVYSEWVSKKTYHTTITYYVSIIVPGVIGTLQALEVLKILTGIGGELYNLVVISYIYHDFRCII